MLCALLALIAVSMLCCRRYNRSSRRSSSDSSSSSSSSSSSELSTQTQPEWADDWMQRWIAAQLANPSRLAGEQMPFHVAVLPSTAYYSHSPLRMVACTTSLGCDHA